MRKLCLGVDIGGVIIDRANDGTDTSFFSENYLRTTAVEGVFDALRTLVDVKFGDEVYLVSKCGRNVELKTLHWLEHHDFYAYTGIDRSRVHFCRERHEKAGICKRLDITHFVDDRLEVLSHLTMVDVRYLFQPRAAEVRKFSHILPNVQQVQSWQELLTHELRS